MEALFSELAMALEGRGRLRLLQNLGCGAKLSWNGKAGGTVPYPAYLRCSGEPPGGICALLQGRL